MVYHAKMMCLHVLEFYVMLLICYFTLLLYWWGLRLLSISLCFSNLCDHTFFILIWIIIMGCILMLSFIMIPINTTTMLLRWILLIQNTHLAISWKIPSLMNWESSYSPIVRKITMLILWTKVTLLRMLSYFNAGVRQRVFILHLFIFSLPYLMIWDVDIIFLAISSSNKMRYMGASLQPFTI